MWQEVILDMKLALIKALGEADTLGEVMQYYVQNFNY